MRKPLPKRKSIENVKKTPNQKSKKKFNKRIFLFILFGCIFIFSAYKLGRYYYDIHKTNKEIESLQKEVLHNGIAPSEEDEKEMKEILSVDFDKLKTINEDIRGWIRYNDEKVNYPIVQSSDNDYYLTHSFNKKNNSVGSIFMDHRNESFDDKNVVLFGHNTANDTMFGSLNNIFQKDFFEDESHRFIEIMYNDGTNHKYEIFSYYVIEKEEYYITTSFNDSEFKQFISTIQRRSFKKFQATATTKDKILTLSTCNGSSGTTKRTVIHAKKVE